MPLDKSRIQGIGSQGEPLKCPEGHTLQEWTARAGMCDGCRSRVLDGAKVLDCRRCNWYLCETCKDTYQPPDTSFWGTLSSMADIVAQDFTELVQDVKSLVGAADEEEPGASQAEASSPQSDMMASPQVQEEASELLNEFCASAKSEDMAGALPSEAELDGLWGRCSILYGCVLQPGPIADAICVQLTMAGNERPWQPSLRALCTLEHFHHKGAVGREITAAVAVRAKPVIRCFAEGGPGAPHQCKEKAEVVVSLLFPTPETPQPEPAPAQAAQATVSAAAEAPPPQQDLLLDDGPAAPSKQQDLLDLGA